MSARREFGLFVAAGLLLAALGLVLGGWTVPGLLEFAVSWPVLIIALWLVVLALAIVVFGRAPALADAELERARARARGPLVLPAPDVDWLWPRSEGGSHGLAQLRPAEDAGVGRS